MSYSDNTAAFIFTGVGVTMGFRGLMAVFFSRGQFVLGTELMAFSVYFILGLIAFGIMLFRYKAAKPMPKWPTYFMAASFTGFTTSAFICLITGVTGNFLPAYVWMMAGIILTILCYEGTEQYVIKTYPKK